MNTIVLISGGKATRLFPASKYISKFLYPIYNRPFIGYQLDLLKNNGFTESGAVRKDKQNFMKSLHPLLQFVEEKCIQGVSLHIEVNDLHKIYCKWCEEAQYRKLARNRFTEQILMNFPNVERKPFSKNRRIHFMGIDAASEFQIEEEDEEEDGE